jgi:hypothetical protein
VCLLIGELRPLAFRTIFEKYIVIPPKIEGDYITEALRSNLSQLV